MNVIYHIGCGGMIATTVEDCLDKDSWFNPDPHKATLPNGNKPRPGDKFTCWKCKKDVHPGDLGLERER